MEMTLLLIRHDKRIFSLQFPFNLLIIFSSQQKSSTFFQIYFLFLQDNQESNTWQIDNLCHQICSIPINNSILFLGAIIISFGSERMGLLEETLKRLCEIITKSDFESPFKLKWVYHAKLRTAYVIRIGIQSEWETEKQDNEDEVQHQVTPTKRVKDQDSLN